jgi:hypothetical protein
VKERCVDFELGLRCDWACWSSDQLVSALVSFNGAPDIAMYALDTRNLPGCIQEKISTKVRAQSKKLITCDIFCSSANYRNNIRAQQSLLKFLMDRAIGNPHCNDSAASGYCLR